MKGKDPIFVEVLAMSTGSMEWKVDYSVVRIHCTTCTIICCHSGRDGALGRRRSCWLCLSNHVGSEACRETDAALTSGTGGGWRDPQDLI